MNRVFFYVWIALACIILPYFYFTAQIYQYGHQNAPKGYRFPKLSDLWVLIPGVAAFGIIQRVVLTITTPYLRKYVKSQDDPELCAKYTKKSSESMVKLAYYTLLCSWTYSILKDTTWLPWYCGGKTGSFDALNENMPFLNTPEGVYECFLMYLSLYVYQLIELFANGLDRPDFNEMLAHHICAVSCTLCAIYANSLGTGILVAYLHALSDIPVCFSRIFASMKYVTPMLISYVVMVSCWLWIRIGCLGYILYRLWGRRFPAELSRFDNFFTVECLFSNVLYVLHWHWLRLMVLMLLHFKKSGATTDLQMQIKKKAE
jgi:hypothetical protein